MAWHNGGRTYGYKASERMAHVLDAAHLYLGDNGRCFCGALKCAGMTAHFSGRDLSGQRVMQLRPEDNNAPGLEAPGFRCETCGKRLVA